MTAKEWLNRGYRINLSINALRRERDTAYDMACSVTAQYSGERVQTSKSNTAEKKIVSYVTYNERINEQIAKLMAVKTEIIEAVSKVEDSILRAILIDRYCRFMKWDEIADEIHYSNVHTIRLHGKALAEMQKVLRMI